MAHKQWYNSYVNAVNGTSSDAATIATVEKFICDGRLSTAELLGVVILILGFFHDPEISNYRNLYYRFFNIPKILCPNKLISLVTTIGYFNLIALNNPSGNLANSESLTAITVVLLLV